MKYLIIGGGALGSWLAHALKRANCQVSLVETDSARLARLKHPVGLVGYQIAQPLALSATDWDGLSGAFDVAILAVKPADAEAALQLLSAGFKQMPVVCAMGGLDGLKLLREWDAEVIQAVVNSEMRLLQDGNIETGFANFIWLGNVASTLTPLMETVQRDLSWAAPSLTTRAIVGMIWSKVAYSLEAALPALFDQHPAAFFARPEARALAVRVVREVQAVAERFGIAPIGFDFFDPPLYRANGAGQRFTLDTWIKNAWIRHEQYRVGAGYNFPNTCGLGYSLSPLNPTEELSTLLVQMRQAASVVGVATLTLADCQGWLETIKSGGAVNLESILAGTPELA